MCSKTIRDFGPREDNIHITESKTLQKVSESILDPNMGVCLTLQGVFIY